MKRGAERQLTKDGPDDDDDIEVRIAHLRTLPRLMHPRK